MKDIKLNTGFKQSLYFLSWIGFILLGMFVIWIVAIVLYSYGKHTIEDKKRTKGILNMTYQKFIYFYGIIAFGLFFVSFIIGIIVSL